MKKETLRKIRLLIASDAQIIREGLHHILASHEDIELVGSAATISETIRLVGELQPHVLLLEPHMHNPDGAMPDGITITRLIRGEWPQVAVIAYTAHTHENSMIRVLQAGAAAYLTIRHDLSALLHTIQAAARGGTLLRTEDVTRLLRHLEASHDHLQPSANGSKQESDLTDREREVLQRLALGERNKEIARRLAISEPTVKSHIANIFFKLQVDSRTAAVATAIERGILSPVRESRFL